MGNGNSIFFMIRENKKKMMAQASQAMMPFH